METEEIVNYLNEKTGKVLILPMRNGNNLLPIVKLLLPITFLSYL